MRLGGHLDLPETSSSEPCDVAHHPRGKIPPLPHFILDPQFNSGLRTIEPTPPHAHRKLPHAHPKRTIELRHAGILLPSRLYGISQTPQPEICMVTKMSRASLVSLQTSEVTFPQIFPRGLFRRRALGSIDNMRSK